ncbi:MAG: hypothetical protein U0518_06050 [Candidatus Gracilibacteria bacterium]
MIFKRPKTTNNFTLQKSFVAFDSSFAPNAMEEGFDLEWNTAF